VHWRPSIPSRDGLGASMKSISTRIPLIFALALGFAWSVIAPAAADSVYGAIFITNTTDQMISIGGFSSNKFGGVGMSGWGCCFVEMPDGSPPSVLGPGQTMLFASQSSGGVATGTGGSISIPQANQTTVITWSVPWAVFNWGIGANCGSNISINPISCQGSATFCVTTGQPNPTISVEGGFASQGNNVCVFRFGLTAP
jgi:hypothetical protein